MENSIYTPPKKEGFRTKSKVALKKKGALFGHSSQMTLMPKSMRAGNGNKKTKTKRRMKVRAVNVAVGNESPMVLSSAWKTKCKFPGMWSKTSLR